MYTQEYLAKERHQERLRQAEAGRAASQVTELRKLEKRQERAERQLLHAWQRVEQLRSQLTAGDPTANNSSHGVKSPRGNPGRARAVPGFFVTHGWRPSRPAAA